VSPDLIVSYDGTPNDDDALALGKVLARSGATLALAYVRHAREFSPRREELAEHDAERRLEQGASWLGDPGVARHVVISASTGEGLAQLARDEGAAMIVFGSDYRTPPGQSEPGTSAQFLLEGGSVAVAVAAAGLRTESDAAIRTVAVTGGAPGDAAHETAQTLVSKLGAVLVEPESASIDLVVIASQPTAPAGRIALSGATRAMLNSAAPGSVLVVPQGTPVQL
jgi:nucleotide-binding universal stress UspA family protein